MDDVRGLLPDYVDPLPRNRADIWYFVTRRRFVATLIVALLAVWLLWPTPVTAEEPTDSEVRVSEFFAALQRRDVDTAMSMTSGVPAGADAGFLTPSAMSDDWRVKTVRDEYRFGDEPVEVDVSVTLVGADGYDYPMWLLLTRDSVDDPWILEDPFTLVSFPMIALAYVEANGVRLPEPTQDPSDYEPPQFAMFPGSYRFYSDVDSLIEVGSEPTMLAGGVHTVAVPDLRMVDESAAQRAVNAYVDECAALPALQVGGCPFGTDRVPDPEDDERLFDDASKVEWEVVEYPIVTVAGNNLNLTDRQRGAIRLTVTGVDPGTEAAVLDCQILTDRLSVRVLPDGRLQVYPEGYAGALLDVDETLIERRTCDV
ncbi:hypothetical protein ACFQ3B_10310 [Stackebrandtia endophytica]|uniref:hypothetical protein n=1 Tax=Stackebrandtia endophytica TaxID=1496996 RepID=UPI0011548140|nr:hypothetical protein [Stackebrandtia endophytica]